MVRCIYGISLRLKTPSEEGKKVNFYSKKDDLLEAAKEFNEKYRLWSKRIIVAQIQKSHFNLILAVEKNKEKITTREIRSFTAYLNHEKDWKQFSRETSKLFEGIEFEKISVDEAEKKLKEIVRQEDLYEVQKIDVNYLLENMSSLKHNLSNNFSNANEETDDIDDEQALAILQYLLKTRDLGSSFQAKRETINEIKNILLKWI